MVCVDKWNAYCLDLFQVFFWKDRFFVRVESFLCPQGDQFLNNSVLCRAFPSQWQMHKLLGWSWSWEHSRFCMHYGTNSTWVSSIDWEVNVFNWGLRCTSCGFLATVEREHYTLLNVWILRMRRQSFEPVDILETGTQRLSSVVYIADTILFYRQWP